MAALLVVLGCGLLISGCSAATPLCDSAAALLTQGRPADAMALYARAAAQDEGNCAANGLAAAGEQIGDAAEEEAAGAAAELAGDTAGAIAAYQSALALNSGDARAAAGLVRLGQQVGTPPPAQIPPLPPAPAPGGWWRTEWPLVIGAALLAVALGAAGYALVRQDLLRRRLAALETVPASPAAVPGPDPAVLDDLRSRTDANAEALADRCANLESALARLEAGGARRDRLVELLAGQLAGPPAGGVQREQLFEASPPADATGEGSGVIDVRLVGVAMADGTRRTVAQRVRWTPPDDDAAAALRDQLGPDPVTVADALDTGTVTPAWAHSTELWLLPSSTAPIGDLSADPDTDGPLEALVRGDALRADDLVELTADTVGLLDRDGDVAFLARLVTVVVQGAWTHASLSSEAHDAASGVAAAALEAAAGLTGPVWAGSTGRTPGPPAELDRLLGRPPQDRDERVAGPVTVFVVADPATEDDPAPATGDDGTVLRMRTAYRIDRFAVDVEAVLRTLHRAAAGAADRLAADPRDPAAVEAFRAAVHPAPSPGPARPTSTVACEVLAIGDRERHDLDFTYRVATARLDLARLLAGSADLTRAFGEQLAAARAGREHRVLDAALREAAGPEQLGTVVATLPGRSPVLTVGPETAGAVESHYAPPDAVTEEVPADHEPVRNGNGMYAALRKPVAVPEPDGPHGATRIDEAPDR